MPIEFSGATPPRPSTTRDSTASTQVTPGPQTATSTAETEEAKTATDRVTLSGAAAQMHAIESVIAATPTVDLRRVEDIKQQTDNNAYRIDPQQVANKLMTFEQQLCRGLAA